MYYYIRTFSNNMVDFWGFMCYNKSINYERLVFMKKYFKIVLTVVTALALSIGMVGCREKNPDEITEKDIEKALADLDKSYGGKKDSATERQEIDPFENLKVTFGGISPNSEINMTGGLSYVTYTAHIVGSEGLLITGSYNNIKGAKNGDVVTIVA